MVVSVGEPSLLREVSAWFWTDSFWLPENVTWSDVDEWKNFPHASDLFYCFPIAVSYLLLQCFLQRLFLTPLARFYGIKIREAPPPSNSFLENVFQNRKKSPATHKVVKKLSEELNWSERQVERWFRQREKMQKGGKFKKFKESGWRVTFYGFICIYGFLSLWDKSWLWNLEDCWRNYSTYKISDDIWWYYILELSFYLFLMISQFTDVIRKDFWEMMIHHIVTVILIAASFVSNNVRFGSLILLCHDLADVPLECGKLTKYIKKATLCNVFFVLFVLVWFPTRLGYLPFVLLSSSMNNSFRTLGSFRYFVNGLLSTLILLHLIWSWMILKVLHRALFQGELDDVRSDSEASTTDSSRKKSN